MPGASQSPKRGPAPLDKRSRVRKRREYLDIQARGRRVVLAHFVLILARRTEGSQGPRLGITASRKVGSAVVRNRAKRLIREAFRATRDLFAEELDVVVIVRNLPSDFRLDRVVSEWRAAGPLLRRKTEEALRGAGAKTPSVSPGG
jgi:ribonuclease P protein component